MDPRDEEAAMDEQAETSEGAEGNFDEDDDDDENRDDDDDDDRVADEDADDEGFDQEARPISKRLEYIIAGAVGFVAIFGCFAAAVALFIDWEGAISGGYPIQTFSFGGEGAKSGGGGASARSGHKSLIAGPPVAAGKPPIYRSNKLDDESCENFHNFACSVLPSVLRNDLVTDEKDVAFAPMRSFLEVYRSLVEQPPEPGELPTTKLIRQMVMTCTDKETVEARGTTPLKRLVRSLGGWPLMDGVQLVGDIASALRIMGNITRLWGSNSVVDVTIGPSSLSDTEFIIQLTPANVERITTYYPRKAPEHSIDNDDYIFSIVYAAHALSQRPDNFAAVKAGAQELVKMEKLLKNLTISEKLHDSTVMTIAELSDYTKVNWLSFFQTVFSDTKLITNNEKISVSDKQTIRNIIRVISATPDSETVLTNVVMWHIVRNLIWHTNVELQTLSDKLRAIPTDEFPATFRAMRCVDFVMTSLPYAVTRHYADKFANEKDTKAAEEIAVNVKNFFALTVNKADWLSLDSRKAMRKKVEDIRIKIGYPKWILSNDFLQEFHKTVKAEDGHFENVVSTAHMNARNRIQRLVEPNYQFDLWMYSPMRVNAIYYFEENTIYITLGLIRSLGFNKDTPLPAKYGGLGSILAHEFAHALDGIGLFFGSRGKEEFSLDPVDRPVYEQRATCLVNQYNHFCPDMTTRKCVNGNNTLPENFADNVGISVAYKTFLKQWGGDKLDTLTHMRGFEDYSPQQLFFMDYTSLHCLPEGEELNTMFTKAQFHSPPQFRVNGPLSNMKEFLSVFVCSEDGLMNRREDRCEFW